MPFSPILARVDFSERERQAFRISAVFCIVVCMLEWVISWHHLDLLQTLVQWGYVALLAGMAVRPLPFSCAMAVLAIPFFLAPPLTDGPTVYWGLWLALFDVGFRLKPRVSMPLTLAVVASDILNDVIIHPPLNTYNLSFALSFLLFCGIGTQLQHLRQLQRTRDELAECRRERERQDERLRLLQTLHDVGGTLSYALLLCRNAEADDDPDTLHADLRAVSETLTEGISLLRTNVMTPLKAQVTPADGTMHEDDTLDGVIARQEARLARAGLTGSIRVAGTYHGERERFLCHAITELCNNILTHGTGAYYLMARCADNGALTVISGNGVADGDAPHRDGHGLQLLSMQVFQQHGTMQAGTEGGEWTVRILLPPVPSAH
ncbi:MAG: hypothetical protein UHD09_06530 [Bifidobacterium sp.]|nr:hypothetical protein [Bifidobacterium sp.]